MGLFTRLNSSNLDTSFIIFFLSFLKMDLPREIENLCRKLKPILGEQADLLWLTYLSDDEKAKKQTSLDIQILAEKLLRPQTLSGENILLPPPSKQSCLGEFFVGNVSYQNRNIQKLNLHREDFIKQIGIFAITGEGKTNLAFSFAIQLLKKNIPFLVIDWKRSWRSLYTMKDCFPELKNLRIFTVGRDIVPFLWNPFRPPPSADRYLWINTVSDVLEKSHLSGPGVAYYINNIYSQLLRGLKGEFFPNFHDGLRELKNYRVLERELRWKQTALRIFQSFTIGQSEKCFNTRNPLKIEDLLSKPVIIELDMELPKSLRLFITETILRWIHLYRLGEGETQRLRHVLFLEEVHNLFQSNSFYKNDQNSVENIYREIRAFGQGIVSITQHPSLLPIYLLGNCHTQIFLGLQHDDDIKAARRSLFLNPTDEKFLSLLKTGESIVRVKNRIDPCLVKTPLIDVVKGQATDSWLSVNTPWNFQKPIDDKRRQRAPYLPADKYISSKYVISNSLPILGEKHLDLLKDMHAYPLSPTTARYRRLSINPKFGTRFKNSLIATGLVQPQKIVTEKGWITLYDITKKGFMILRDSGIDAKQGNEGIVHKFWKHKIADEYRAKGYQVEIEKELPNGNRPDIIVEKDGKKTAIEIETGKSSDKSERDYCGLEVVNIEVNY